MKRQAFWQATYLHEPVSVIKVVFADVAPGILASDIPS